MSDECRKAFEEWWGTKVPDKQSTAYAYAEVAWQAAWNRRGGVDLSEIQRYGEYDFGMWENQDGEWVKFSDLATIQPKPVEVGEDRSCVTCKHFDADRQWCIPGPKCGVNRSLWEPKEALRTQPKPLVHIEDHGPGVWVQPKPVEVGEVLDKLSKLWDNIDPNSMVGEQLKEAEQALEALRPQPQAPAVEVPTIAELKLAYQTGFDKEWESPEWTGDDEDEDDMDRRDASVEAGWEAIHALLTKGRHP